MEMVYSHKGHEGICWNAVWNHKGDKIASCGKDRQICIYSFIHGNWTLTDILKDAHTKTIRKVSFSLNGRLLAAAGFDGLISIWSSFGSTMEWKCIANVEGHENEVKSVAWSPDGHFLSTAGRDKTVWIWEVTTDEDHDDNIDFECLAVLAEHSQDVKHVLFHPFNSRLLISTSYDDTIRVWKADIANDDEWYCAQILTCHSATVWSCKFSPCGNYLVSVGADLSIKVHKKGTGSQFETIASHESAHSRPILDVCVHSFNESFGVDPSIPSEKLYLATCSEDRTVKVWIVDLSNINEPTIKLLHTFITPERKSFNSVSWSPNQSQLLLVTSDEGEVILLTVPNISVL